ncbi:NifU-like protein [Clostridium sp. MSTE9]|uniref:NifU family protein n=1 Tax=Clostridium sp. (strain MSTE9) TaxID=1105031 RepID=UPI00026F244A|nr:NifU family protein [Clostridium sp. MSTE9]EJF38356.1 NifU-like protein [Clostridium sp. MSTE9]
MAEMGREPSEEMEEQVRSVIKNTINPELLKHNGWIELVQVTGDTVCVRFRGACSGCLSIYETLDAIVKPKLMEKVKGIRDVMVSDEVSEELIEFSRSLFTHQK